MSILILLSTYNGEHYLAEQLDSIMSQSLSNWILLIRDDGSNDNTLDIINEYKNKDHRIQLLQDNLGNLNSRGSFAALMQNAVKRNEDYIFFSDQDDIWLPEKLEKSVAVLARLEQQHGNHTPALMHTDLKVVDHRLNVIHDSYLQFERLTRNTQNPIKTLLINNYVTGCTMGINRALLLVATPVPITAYMHDWWCALCAAATGHIEFVKEATIYYRQHGNNSIGSTGLAGKIKDLVTLKKGFSQRLTNLKACFTQATDLLSRINISNDNYKIIESFIMLPEFSLNKRYTSTHELQLVPASRHRRIMFFLMMAFV